MIGQAFLLEEQAYTMLFPGFLVHGGALVGDHVAALFEEQSYTMIGQASLVHWDAVLAAYVAALL